MGKRRNVDLIIHCTHIYDYCIGKHFFFYEPQPGTFSHRLDYLRIYGPIMDADISF